MCNSVTLCTSPTSCSHPFLELFCYPKQKLHLLNSRSLSPATQPLETSLLLYISLNLAIQGTSFLQVESYSICLYFVYGLFHLASAFKFCPVSEFHSFVRLNSISLHVSTIFYLLIRVLMDIWVVSTFSLLSVMLLRTWNAFGLVLSALPCVQPEVVLLAYIVIPCSTLWGTTMLVSMIAIPFYIHLNLTPGSGRLPWRKEWIPAPVFLLGEFHGQTGLVSCSP